MTFKYDGFCFNCGEKTLYVKAHYAKIHIGSDDLQFIRVKFKCRNRDCNYEKLTDCYLNELFTVKALNVMNRPTKT